MTYSVSQQFYFREIHRSIAAGGSVYLDDEVAQKYMKSHPGLLKPARATTQGAPKAVRAESEATDAPPESKPEEKRRKKSA